MSTLILKLGATGDVVRTTTLLRRLHGPVTWLTSATNQVLLRNLEENAGDLRVLAWEDRSLLNGASFDLVVNLEDESETAAILKAVHARQLFGAYLDESGRMTYTRDSSPWFDMSLISVHGREKADDLKLKNRCAYQELIFEGLGWTFAGERYLLPETEDSNLHGDVAIAPEAGPVWPMKAWAHYDRLKKELVGRGLKVNFLPRRPTLLEHLADVRAHQCLVSGDSLPMHLALGSGVRCVALFNCTSPWEICDYGILTKLISPRLEEFFYKRGFNLDATAAISFDDVLCATLMALESAHTTSKGSAE